MLDIGNGLLPVSYMFKCTGRDDNVKTLLAELIDKIVRMTNDVDDALDDILNIRRELTGELDAEKEN